MRLETSLIATTIALHITSFVFVCWVLWQDHPELKTFLTAIPFFVGLCLVSLVMTALLGTFAGTSKDSDKETVFVAFLLYHGFLLTPVLTYLI